jgi:hypothetical protein
LAATSCANSGGLGRSGLDPVIKQLTEKPWKSPDFFLPNSHGPQAGVIISTLCFLVLTTIYLKV